jgi:hypothetical protein
MVGTLFEADMAPFIATDILPVEQRQRPLHTSAKRFVSIAHSFVVSQLRSDLREA